MAGLEAARAQEREGAEREAEWLRRQMRAMAEAREASEQQLAGACARGAEAAEALAGLRAQVAGLEAAGREQAERVAAGAGWVEEACGGVEGAVMELMRGCEEVSGRGAGRAG